MTEDHGTCSFFCNCLDDANNCKASVGGDLFAKPKQALTLCSFFAFNYFWTKKNKTGSRVNFCLDCTLLCCKFKECSHEID